MSYESDPVVQALGKFFSEEGDQYSFGVPQIEERLPVTAEEFFSATDTLRFRSKVARGASAMVMLITGGAILRQNAMGNLSLSLWVWFLPAFAIGLAITTMAFQSVIAPFRRRLIEHVTHDLKWRQRGLRSAVGFMAPTLLKSIIALALMIYPIVGLFAEHNRRAALADHGVAIVARVVNVDDRQRHCSTQYIYDWKGHSYSGSASYCWHRATGTPMTIWVDPNLPHNQIASDEHVWPPEFWIFAVVAIVLGASTMLLVIVTAQAYVPPKKRTERLIQGATDAPSVRN